MALPTPPSTPPAQSPPKDSLPRWVALALGSVALHVLAFWLLRLVLMGRLQGLQSANAYIPIDVVAVTTPTTAPTPSTPTPKAAATPPSTPNPSPQSANPPTPQPIPQPSPASESPQIQTSPPQPQAPTTPSPPANRNSSATPPTATAPPPSPNPPTGQPSATSQSGSGFIATGQLQLIDNNWDTNLDPSRHPGDKLAQLREKTRRFATSDAIESLGIEPNQAIVLDVVVLIDSSGRPTVLRDRLTVQQGNLNPTQAEQLARTILEGWTFTPTQMAGSPVDWSYSLTLTINPTSDSGGNG